MHLSHLPLIAVIWALICRRAVALSDQMWLRAIAGFMGGGDWEEGGAGAAERRQLRVLHILPVSVHFQTTRPGEMTAGAANCEINWTCDPKGRDQHPARGDERASALTLGHDKGTAKPGGAERIRGQFPRQDVSGHGWASLDLCDIAADCARRAVMLLALVRGIILKRNWICSQMYPVNLMIGL